MAEVGDRRLQSPQISDGEVVWRVGHGRKGKALEASWIRNSAQVKIHNNGYIRRPFPGVWCYQSSTCFRVLAEDSSTVEIYIYLGLVVLRINGRRNAPHFFAYMPPLHWVECALPSYNHFQMSTRWSFTQRLLLGGRAFEGEAKRCYNCWKSGSVLHELPASRFRIQFAPTGAKQLPFWCISKIQDYWYALLGSNICFSACWDDKPACQFQWMTSPSRLTGHVVYHSHDWPIRKCYSLLCIVFFRLQALQV